MVRLLALGVAVSFCLHIAPVSAADSFRRCEFSLGADLGYIDTSGYRSWAEGSVGKLRFDDTTDGIKLSRAFADVRCRTTDTSVLNLSTAVYDDDIGPLIDVTEAFVEWRPMTDTVNRYRLKFGAFYPRISLENTDAGWASPYTINSSALNTWVAEEFRVFGAELGIVRRPESLGGLHTFSAYGAIFYNNDPAGALLAWKGWSIHDRQTRFSDRLPLPALPQLQPDMLFEQQAPFLEVFREIDNTAGYYVGGQWRYSNRMLLRVLHYDNHVDPDAFENGQYGWYTEFDVLGLQATVPGGIGLIAQWMGGTTVRGPVFSGTGAVDADYYSAFLLLTKAIDKHRITIRYDRFEVGDNDGTPLDDNSEYGNAWTLAYRFRIGRNASIVAEWLEIESYRTAWEYFGLNDLNTERQIQLGIRLRFGSQH